MISIRLASGSLAFPTSNLAPLTKWQRWQCCRNDTSNGKIEALEGGRKENGSTEQ